MPGFAAGRQPIGVFDSGVGGLTILEALRRHMPHRDFVYVGDTAREPYGSKAPGMVLAFSGEILEFLCGLGVDGVVMASHSASAVALPEVAEACDVPVWGVIDSGVEAAARATRSGRVGVIGSKATIGSGAFQRRLERRGLRWWAHACPMLAHVAEEGLADSPEAELLARHYLANRPEMDTLILGDAQYALLREAIGRAAGSEVMLVDSAEVMAEAVSKTFPPPPRCFRQGRVVHYVSGDPAAFAQTAKAIATVEEVLRLPCPRGEHGEARKS
jgi:glutamate racemase